MLRCFLLVVTLMCSVTALAKEPPAGLPTPHYRPQASDPEWLKIVVQFHGHLGPAVVAGARVGMAGLHAVDAKGYFDVDISCEGPMAKPPQSCFLDGLQIGTGATLGKRSLHWQPGPQVKVRFTNTTTGTTAELTLTRALLDLLQAFAQTSISADTHDHSPAAGNHEADSRLESTARRIAVMAEKDLVTVRAVSARTR
jgi:formylmethanofuran dehydrogenase subunit E